MKSLSGLFLLLYLGIFAPSAMAQDLSLNVVNEDNVDRALAVFEQKSADDNAENAVSGLIGRGQIALARGDLETAEKLSAEAVTKMETLGRRNGWRVVVSWFESQIALAKKDIPGARKSIEQAASLIESGAGVSAAWEGIVQYQISIIEDNDNSKARKAILRSIDAYDVAGLHREKGCACMRLGDLEWGRGKKRRAFSAYDDALRFYGRADHAQLDRLMAHLHIADRHIQDGSMNSAASHLDKARDEFKSAGSPAALAPKIDALSKRFSPQK